LRREKLKSRNRLNQTAVRFFLENFLWRFESFVEKSPKRNRKQNAFGEIALRRVCLFSLSKTVFFHLFLIHATFFGFNEWNVIDYRKMKNSDDVEQKEKD